LKIERIERRLAAVLAMDVAGYSRLMGRDEEDTLTRLKAVRKNRVDPTIDHYRGRIVKTTGDGLLVEFASAVDASRSAIDIQTGMTAENADVPQDRRIVFRIGIHVGDIIFDDNDIFGDGVNIAARLEGIADIGGLCISDDAYRQVRGKVDAEFDDIGEQVLKNIAEPMRAWRLKIDGVTPKPATEKPLHLALPDKPSIAVMPFQNMSGDTEQEYFADGMVEDIITALSRFKSLFVIARNSSFAYKGKAVDSKQVGRELGVRYILEGSVRKAGLKVRITGQLIDTFTGAHLWADRFDGQVEDIFELQDQVTAGVVGQLVTQVQFAESERANRKSTANLQAHDYYWRGVSSIWQWTKASNEAAGAYFQKAIELDQTYAAAHAFAGHVYALRKQSRWMTNPEHEIAESIRHARLAIELGQNDELALCFGGFDLAYVAGELDFGIACIERGLSMNINFAWGWGRSGWTHLYLGEHKTALSHLDKAERLSPRDPAYMQVKMAMSYARFFLGEFREASLLAEAISRESPSFQPALRVAAMSQALDGNTSSAVEYTKKALALDPNARVSILMSQMPLRRREDIERWKEGLLKAGFPE
jgi:adenylate cyclase